LKRAPSDAHWAPATTPAQAPDLAEFLKLADAAAAAVDSPVRRMQQELEISLAERDYPRWSARRTLAFMLLTNGLFWGGAVWAVLKLF
jgi:hypothetical protein